jgi:hypothetical protein
MAYCTYLDVDALMSVTHTSSTQPTITSVTDFCADVSAELDGVAGAAGYSVPVDSVPGLALMNSYATMGSAVKAWHAGYQAQQEPANVAYWREAYEGFLFRLRRGEQSIPGEVPGNPETATTFSAPTNRVDGYSILGSHEYSRYRRAPGCIRW